MRDQKNGMDTPITEPQTPENEVGFELLWRCIYKIRRTTQRWCM